MDREAIARAQRRQQALESLESERDREAALLDQLQAVIAEEEGPRIDEAAFAKMEPEDVEVVRDALGATPWGADEELGFGLEVDDLSDDEGESIEEEIARLQEEIARSRRRQGAFERYLEALGPD